MKYTPLMPDTPPLLGSIESMFVLEEYAPEHSRERLVPNGRMNLVIELDGRPRQIYHPETGAVLQVCEGAWLSGVHTRYLTLGDTDVSSRIMAVQFAPGRSGPFTHSSADDFADRVVSAEEVFGPAVLDLRTEFMEKADASMILSRLSEWMLARYDSRHEPPSYVIGFLEELLRSPGEARPTEWVERDGSVSYKHFVDRFRRSAGTTPKAMQRILRFAGIFERTQAGEAIDWAGLSQELGFADQAHLIREFVAFSGYSPQDFHDREFERENFFPEEPPG